jgi:hypothetical protein
MSSYIYYIIMKRLFGICTFMIACKIKNKAVPPHILSKGLCIQLATLNHSTYSELQYAADLLMRLNHVTLNVFSLMFLNRMLILNMTFITELRTKLFERQK